MNIPADLCLGLLELCPSFTSFALDDGFSSSSALYSAPSSFPVPAQVKQSLKHNAAHTVLHNRVGVLRVMLGFGFSSCMVFLLHIIR